MGGFLPFADGGLVMAANMGGIATLSISVSSATLLAASVLLASTTFFSFAPPASSSPIAYIAEWVTFASLYWILVSGSFPCS